MLLSIEDEGFGEEEVEENKEEGDLASTACTSTQSTQMSQSRKTLNKCLAGHH